MKTVTLGNGNILISCAIHNGESAILFQPLGETNLPIGTDMRGAEDIPPRPEDTLLIVRNREAALVLQDGLLFLFREINRREEAEKAETSKSDPLPQEERKKEK